MQFAVISDTHGNVANFKKIVAWLDRQSIQLILHCGDIGSPESLKESLADFKGELRGVLGNMDKDYKILLAEYNKIPRVKIEENILETTIENIKIALTHKPEEAEKLGATGQYGLIFYGHTHQPWQDKIGNYQLINPGEAAGQYYKPTFAVYDTISAKLELKILERLD